MTNRQKDRAPVSEASSTPDQLRDENCAQEPIRTPGSIQAHGALFGFDRESGRLVVASENAGEFAGMPVEQMLGKTVAEG